MKLTELELAIMKAGNPPTLDPGLPSDWRDYSERHKQELVDLYVRRRSGYRTIAAELGWSEKAAKNLLSTRGVLRKPRTIPAEDYRLLRGLITADLTTVQIAAKTGWTVFRVKRLKENLRKQGFRRDQS